MLGQSDFEHVAPNDDNQDGTPDGDPSDPTPSARTFGSPSGLHLSGSRLIVADGDNNRCLIFNRQ